MGSHIVPLHLLLVLLVFTFLRQRQKGFFDIKCFPRDPKWNLNSRIGKIIRTKSQSGKAQQQRKETRAFFSDGKVLLPNYPMKREILEHDKVPRNGVQWKNQAGSFYLYFYFWVFLQLVCFNTDYNLEHFLI